MVDLVRLMGSLGVGGGEVSRSKARRGIGRRSGRSVELMAACCRVGECVLRAGL